MAARTQVGPLRDALGTSKSVYQLHVSTVESRRAGLHDEAGHPVLVQLVQHPLDTLRPGTFLAGGVCRCGDDDDVLCRQTLDCGHDPSAPLRVGIVPVQLRTAAWQGKQCASTSVVVVHVDDRCAKEVDGALPAGTAAHALVAPSTEVGSHARSVPAPVDDSHEPWLSGAAATLTV